jgi:hypothetical protein
VGRRCVPPRLPTPPPAAPRRAPPSSLVPRPPCPAHTCSAHTLASPGRRVHHLIHTAGSTSHLCVRRRGTTWPSGRTCSRPRLGRSCCRHALMRKVGAAAAGHTFPLATPRQVQLDAGLLRDTEVDSPAKPWARHDYIRKVDDWIRKVEPRRATRAHVASLHAADVFTGTRWWPSGWRRSW